MACLLASGGCVDIYEALRLLSCYENWLRRRSGAHPLNTPQRPSAVLSWFQCWGAETLMGTAVWGGAGVLGVEGGKCLWGLAGVWAAFVDWKVDY